MNPKTLHPDDALLVDFTLGRLEAEQARQVRDRLAGDEQFACRSQAVARTLGRLDEYRVEGPDESLYARTMAKVNAAGKTSALLDRESAEARPVSFPTFSLRELGAVAAVLLIAAGVLLPSWQHARALSRRQMCVANAGRIGAGMTQYAHENAGYLPTIARQGAAWMPKPDRPSFSNSQNLFALVRGEFTDPANFVCPNAGSAPLTVTSNMIDFPDARYISYSYHNNVNIAAPLRLGDGPARMVILSDSSPMFEAGRLHAERVGENSANHAGRGQAVLRLDMSADWTERPDVGVDGDNIWTARGVEQYSGDETPADQNDSFMLQSYMPAE